MYIGIGGIFGAGIAIAIVTIIALGAAYLEISNQCGDWVVKNYNAKSFEEFQTYDDICMEKNWIVIKPIQWPAIIHIQEPEVGPK